MAVKVNLGSEIGLFGLIVRVGAPKARGLLTLISDFWIRERGFPFSELYRPLTRLRGTVYWVLAQEKR